MKSCAIASVVELLAQTSRANPGISRSTIYPTGQGNGMRLRLRSNSLLLRDLLIPPQDCGSGALPEIGTPLETFAPNRDTAFHGFKHFKHSQPPS